MLHQAPKDRSMAALMELDSLRKRFRDEIAANTPCESRSRVGVVLSGGGARAYAHIGAVRLPTRGEVRWILPDGPYTYWRGEITSLEPLHRPNKNQ